MLLGVVVGAVFPGVALELKPLGDGFIRLIRMVVAPIIFTTVVVGASLTHQRIPPGFRARFAELFEQSLFDEGFWHSLYRFLQPLFWPYAVGSLLGAIVMAAIAYPLALAFVTSRRRIHDMLHHHKP